MYWWNASKLAEDLREGRVDEKERFKYFLATFIAWNVAVLLLLHSGVSLNTDDLFLAALNLSVAVGGIILCYRVNRSGDNADFVTRMICLGWPVGIQLVVSLSVFFSIFGVIRSLRAVAGGLFSFLSSVSAIPYDVWEFWTRMPGISFFLVLFYYSTICWCLAHVAQAKEAQNLFQMATTELPGREAALAFVGIQGLPIVVILGGVYMASLVGRGMLGWFFALLAGGLWVLLFGWIFVRLRRRSMKRAREDEAQAG